MTRTRRPTENRVSKPTPVPYLFGPTASHALLLAYVTAKTGTAVSFDIGVAPADRQHPENEVVVLVTMHSLRVGFTPAEARAMADVTEETLEAAHDAPPTLTRRMADLVLSLRYAADRADQTQPMEKPN